ncbi:endolytic peptidoglycan transglycosylase RlpA [Xenorhabdus bovienii]|uniref:Endolytic peptidoglycan transglycosylase RlpA n=1 Tax=Xenorhabdus bovienii TaxID=40576 RepID=A0AAJ1J6Z9_XENBV|nr:endolytic peptidoglycan transglycosylase RlpA [Xenorhabdus bovienii]MDE1477921.1 endolytic peptidoglycan transglycosylase RlpA [Xenorhabdus bovienii]MDE9509595.1 endolytic peptidoglycan transglycosylase RlpA [Xenorhabdus bovienii]MDE9521238.1 endolytic peptidoglycan transglycosylase RlpA [Xenorhabdus bovienii]
MRQQWLILGIVAVLISGCTTTGNKREDSSIPPVPTREVLGAEPQYEPYHPSANQDYQRDGQSYRIVQDSANFTQTGYASGFGEEANGKLTAIGERASPYALAAAHPTLPIPCYVRVTNLSNGRMIIIRINDRGPYNKPGKIIELSRAAAERLNLMPQSRVKLDGIQVAPDGSVSGLGTEGATIVKQSYALPDRPNIGAPAMMSSSSEQNITEQNTVGQPDSEQNLSGNTENPFLTSPPVGTPSAPKQSETKWILQPQTQPVATSPVTPEPAATSTGGFMVQVGAISSEQKAKEWQQSLSQRFNVQGRIMQFGNVYRVQLGPLSRQQATELQKKLTDQMHQSSFIVAP